MAKSIQVYVAYARKDGRKYAKRLSDALRDGGIRAWYDSRQIDDYATDHDMSPRLELEIRQADCILVCLTPALAANQDKLLKRELIYAENRNKPFVALDFPGHQKFRNAQVVEQIPFVASGHLKFDEGLHQLRACLDQLPDAVHAAEIDDVFHDYVVDLYDQIVNYLDTTVFSLLTQLYELDLVPKTKGQPIAVLPMHYSDRATYVGIELTKQAPIFDSLAGASSYFNHRCFLIGDTGIGKTTALMVHAREALIRYIENPGQPLPIVAALSDWDGSSSIVEWLARTSNLDADRLFAKFTERQVLLMLDSLDDLSVSVLADQEGQLRDARLEFMRLLNQFAPIPTIITCRTDSYYDLVRSGLDTVSFPGVTKLESLTANDLETYLEVMPDLLNLIRSTPPLSQIGQNPLFIILLVAAYHEISDQIYDLRKVKESVYPLWRSVFEIFVQRLYRVKGALYPSSIPIELIQLWDALEIISCYMYMQTWRMYSNASVSVIHEYELNQIPVDRRIVKFAIDLGILVEDAIGGIAFVSNLIRDAFVFDRLNEYLSSNNAELRLGAARALGFLGDRRAIAMLTLSLKTERDPYIQYAIRAGLDRLRPEYSVFVSYRRKDWGTTFLMAEHLSQEVDATIFLDRYIDDADFEASLLRHLRTSSVMMLVVTEHTFASDRIHLERDWIRKEIQEALTRGIPIVMAIVDDVKLPDEEYLPREIRPVLTKQGYPIHPGSFEQNMVKIADFITAISPILRRESTPKSQKTFLPPFSAVMVDEP